jgi:uncharacterized membrane protein
MTETKAASEMPQIRKVAMEQPWSWLAAGWADMWRAPGISLGYGAIFTLVSAALTAGLFLLGIEYLLLPLAAGFMLLGPMLAVGLYETSRRLHAGEPVSFADALFVAARSPTQLAFMGVLLAFLLMAWMEIALLLFALFFGTRGLPPLDETVHLLFFTWEGLGLLVVGTAVGAVLAAAVFSLTVVSVPLLLVRETDAVSAMITSLRAVRANLPVLALWAWLIAVLTACGVVTLYIGLIVTFPLVGHATWHAYRSLIEEESG